MGENIPQEDFKIEAQGTVSPPPDAGEQHEGPVEPVDMKAPEDEGDLEQPESPKVSPTMNHPYISTACQHELHYRCRLTCKYCETVCRCSCHQTISEEG